MEKSEDRLSSLFTAFPTVKKPAGRTTENPEELLSAIMARKTPGKLVGPKLPDPSGSVGPSLEARKLFEDSEFLELTPEVRAQLEHLAELGKLKKAKSSAEIHRLKKPDVKWDGAESTYQDWAYRWNMYFTLAREPAVEEPERVALALASLIGPAAQWWRWNFVLRPHIGETWDKLHSALRDHFIGEDYYTKHLERLEKVTQTGTVAQYNAAFSDIYFRIPGIEPKHAEHLYLKGLVEFVRGLVAADKDGKDILDLMDAAKRISVRFPSMVGIGTARTFGSGKMEKSPKKDIGGKSKSNVVCHYCSKPGHIKPECRRFLKDKAAGIFAPSGAVANTHATAGNSNKSPNINNRAAVGNALGANASAQPMADGRANFPPSKQTPVKVPAPGSSKSN